MFVFYVIATLFGSLGTQSNAFVNSAPASGAEVKAAAKNSIGGLLSYRAAEPSYPNGAGSGSMAFHPRASMDYGEANGRASVYDPGDELLRTLNAELAANGQELGVLPEEPDYADTVFNELEGASKYDMMRKLENDLREEQEIVTKAALLMKLLADPSIETLPVVYVEESSNGDIDDSSFYQLDTIGQMSKRSRYYRRYPWKRHNRNRSTYEPELRYACTPSKEDVFKLLVNLHENRIGNHGKTVNFCNRKRPAKAVFTNIRFLG